MVSSSDSSDKTSGTEVPLKTLNVTQTHTATVTRTRNTTVDLGEDLLEETAALPGLPEPTHSHTQPHSLPRTDLRQNAPQIADQLESAKILFNEGIPEEAKKLLRRILLIDPSNIGARKKLDEIHQLELKQLLGEPDTHPRARKSRKKEPEIAIDSEAIMRQLDRDLKLGVFGDGDQGEAVAFELSLFGTKENTEKFIAELDSKFVGATGRDRMDLGIAFLEMNLYDLAARQFKAALGDSVQRLAATSHLAFALILAGRPFEATMSLESCIFDPDLKPEEKLDFYYLMGRAQEKQGKRDEALQWFELVHSIDPGFRDLRERMRDCSR